MNSVPLLAFSQTVLPSSSVDSVENGRYLRAMVWCDNILSALKTEEIEKEDIWFSGTIALRWSGFGSTSDKIW